MRPIDADALSKELLERYCNREKQRPLPMSNGYDYFNGQQDECDFIEDYIVSGAPTINAVPVVHGRWITDAGENTLHGVNDKCSICGFRNFSFTFFNYCPNCGADMRGGHIE